MELYSSNNDYKLYQGNMLDMLEVINHNSIDSIITDPPYELNFMSKGWDNAGVSFQPYTWKKCYEVLKDGGYLLAFGGSRTFHRIACAIEDAGFEIRDTIMWLYGSGFPKSLNISKTLEKREGIIEETTGTLFNNPGGKRDLSKRSDYGYIYEPQLYLAKQWQGWGTALKPSYESIIIAQKPYSIEIYLLIGILDILNEVIDKCQLNLNANIVEKISKLNQAKQSVEENIVLNNAESKMFTKEDLLEVMDMLQSTLTENTNLNTELLCLNFLVEICNQMSKYTTETKINLITELKILKLLVVENILKNTIEKNKTKQLGMKQNVLTVEEFLKEEKLKLNYINILSAQDNAILKEEESSLHPKLNQIIVARKPFKGSLVDNVIKNGVGGINIDECRVKTSDKVKMNIRNTASSSDGWNRPWMEDKEKDKLRQEIAIEKANNLGRFPANTILTYDETDFDEVCGGFPNTKSTYNSGTKHENIIHRDNADFLKYGYKTRIDSSSYNDSGNASRYFYCAKSSKKDRDEGLPNKWLDNLELILYNNIGDELWKDKITIKEENKVKHLEDMAASLQKVIEEYGIQTKKDIDLNTLLYGKKSLEKYLKENKYTTKMGINSTTVSQILNLLTLYTTKENTQDAKLETENGTNHVEIVENTNQLEIIIKENQELVPGANNVVLKMLLKINEKEGHNEHCTVKPTNLMQYLVRLVTPNGGTILDPFNGSGSTGKAVMYENKERNKNYKYIGIELTEEYLPISKARIEYVCKLTEEEKNKERQMSIYDL